MIRSSCIKIGLVKIHLLIFNKRNYEYLLEFGSSSDVFFNSLCFYGISFS